MTSSERPKASREEAGKAIQEIKAYHEQGRRSLRELPRRGEHGARAIDEQADKLGWNPTRLRKARQFAHNSEGYSRDRLAELCNLIRDHRPVFGVSHVGLLVTVPWPQRERIQKECVEGNWSTAELQAEIKRQYGARRQGGRRRRVSAKPEHILIQLDQMADTWRRWHMVVAKVNEAGQSALDPLPGEIRDRIKSTAKALTKLQEAVHVELKAAREKMVEMPK
jgi:hypothetical protein